MKAAAIVSAACMGLGFGLGLISFSASAQEREGRMVEPRPGFFIAELDNANVSVLPGPEGTLIVDTQFTNRAEALKNLIAGTFPVPPTLVINSHFHPDHVGGNAVFAQGGARIVADEVTLARMSASFTSPSGRVTPPYPVQARPSIAFADTLRIDWNGEEIFLRTYKRAHSDADTIVYFRHHNVVHMGGLMQGGGYAHVMNVEAMLAALDDIIAMTNKDTVVVPWRGKLGLQADLKDWRAALGDANERVASALQAGTSEAAIAVAEPMQDWDRKLGEGADSSVLIREILASRKAR